MTRDLGRETLITSYKKIKKRPDLTEVKTSKLTTLILR